MSVTRECLHAVLAYEPDTGLFRWKIDHALDNLREATQSQNNANAGLNRRNTSGARGVVFDRARSLWRAEIECRGHRIFLGRFTAFEAAKAAYDQRAIELFGEFAGRVA